MKEAEWNTVVSHELSKHNWWLSIFHTILHRANGNATSEVQHCVGSPSLHTLKTPFIYSIDKKVEELWNLFSN